MFGSAVVPLINYDIINVRIVPDKKKMAPTSAVRSSKAAVGTANKLSGLCSALKYRQLYPNKRGFHT